MIAAVEIIREICHEPWRRALLMKDHVKWTKLWVCVDVINRSQNAIDFYLGLPDFDETTGGYLYMYGLLQALFVQQDAVKNLSVSILDKPIDFKKDFPNLYKIREYRNNAIGHPTMIRNNESFHLMDLEGISKYTFTITSYTKDTSKDEKVEIRKCITSQNTLIKEILNQVIEQMNKEFEKHKENFQGKNLSDHIGSGFNYEFEQLIKGIETDDPLLKINFNKIADAYSNIKIEIEERYISLSTLPGVEDSVRKLDYLFERLRRDFVENKIDDQMELFIFVDALKTYFNEFEAMVKDLDKKFK